MEIVPMNDKFCLQSCGVLPLYLMKEIHSNIWPNLKIGISSCMENSTLNFALPRGKDVITLVEDNPLFNSASSQNLPVLFSYIKLCCPILANKSTWTLKKKEEHLTIIYNCIYDRVSIRFVVSNLQYHFCFCSRWGVQFRKNLRKIM